MRLEEEAASVSQQQLGTHKQLVVFFGNAGIGTRSGWGAKAVLQACRKMVERANSGRMLNSNRDAPLRRAAPQLGLRGTG
ncbi:hypothetical protein HaLaN_14018 [Haematococcus lacustris]|uniref:Uncharacterized protein n=1 Tax=Haematococcus lacustris TaxID=44745 RepID=A0A699ZDI7_HAELA|nr:hypothetical protein HaLaN_14018 [Haematococcus lacustris]